MSAATDSSHMQGSARHLSLSGHEGFNSARASHSPEHDHDEDSERRSTTPATTSAVRLFNGRSDQVDALVSSFSARPSTAAAAETDPLYTDDEDAFAGRDDIPEANADKEKKEGHTDYYSCQPEAPMTNGATTGAPPPMRSDAEVPDSVENEEAVSSTKVFGVPSQSAEENRSPLSASPSVTRTSVSATRSGAPATGPLSSPNARQECEVPKPPSPSAPSSALSPPNSFTAPVPVSSVAHTPLFQQEQMQPQPHPQTGSSSMSHPTAPQPQPQPQPNVQPPASPSILFRRSGFLPTYKVLVVGDVAVGKTNLLSRYCRNEYDPTAPPTIGIEFFSRQLEVPAGRVSEVQPVVVQLWDTAGQERNSVISNAYYRNAVGAMLVYDVTRRDTFLNIPRWLGQVRALANEDCICVVVGNKTDAPETEWAVTTEEGEQLAHTLDMRHYLVSAFNGNGVLHAFTQMVLAVNAVQSVQYEQLLVPPVAPPATKPANTGATTPSRVASAVGSPKPPSTSSAAGGMATPESDPVITRASETSFYAAQERTLWTLPSSVPRGSLAMESASNRTRGATDPLHGSHDSQVDTSSSSGMLRDAAWMGNGQASPPSSAHAAAAARRGKKTLDLRGFGSGQGSGAEGDAAGISGCAC